MNTETPLALPEIDYTNNPFDRPARRTRENGAAYNTNFGKAVYLTPRDAT
jgi:hypothetical protein